MTSFESVAAEKQAVHRRWTRDAFLWRYPLSAFLFTLLFIALLYFEDHYGRSVPYGMPMMILGSLLFLIFVALLLFFFLKRKFKLALAVALGAIILSSPLTSGGHLGEMLFSLIDRIRFYFVGAQYTAVIDRMSPQERASTVVFFDWGEGGYFTTNLFYAVVYDESGEIAKPDAERTLAWIEKVRAHNNLINNPGCRTQAFRLTGHYYSVTTIC